MRHKKTAETDEARMRPESPSTVSLAEVDDTGELLTLDHAEHDRSVSADLSAGDLDARWDQGETGGEETVGGSAPTPDQDVVDEIGRAVGITYEEGEPLRVGEKEQERDEHRWELDPASSEDFDERSREARDAEPVLKMQHHDQYKRAE